MSKVYIVTQGEYDSYEIVRVFADETLANAYRAQYGGRVEPHDVTTEWTPGDHPWKVLVWDDGHLEAKKIARDQWGFVDVFRPIFCPKYTEVYVEAQNSEEAIAKAQVKLEEQRVEA